MSDDGVAGRLDAAEYGIARLGLSAVARAVAPVPAEECPTNVVGEIQGTQAQRGTEMSEISPRGQASGPGRQRASRCAVLANVAWGRIVTGFGLAIAAGADFGSA